MNVGIRSSIKNVTFSLFRCIKRALRVCPKAEEKAVKFPIALGLEKDDYKPELLIKRWDILNRPKSLFYWDLDNGLYDSNEMKKKVEGWSKWLAKIEL